MSVIYASFGAFCYFSDDPSKQFIIAAENNDLEAVKRLLCQNPSLISSRDNDQYSALHRAAYSGHQEMVEVRAGAGSGGNSIPLIKKYNRNGQNLLFKVACMY